MGAAAARSVLVETADTKGQVESRPGARWPRITLVTAVYNGEKYIEDTIRSILGQGYPNLEYIVVDGGSTDGTAGIVQKFEKYLTRWIREPDKGMYEALNKGFARATGEVMGWLNASDQLHNHGLFVVGSLFRAMPKVEWITGRPTKFSDEGMTIEVMKLPRWSRWRFLAGANKYIQQESTFWRRSLWEQAGGRVEERLRAEGDFELWARFFRHARLYSVDALIGGYRLHEGSLGAGNIEKYDRTCDGIVKREIELLPRRGSVKAFRWISKAVRPIPKVRGLWYRLAIKNLYRLPGSDWAPVIRFDPQRGWHFSK